VHRLRHLRRGCPSNAIEQAGFTDAQVLSEVYALLADRSGAVTA
jgi:hypothetical protein